MTISWLDKDLWPVMFKSFSDKSISYAVTPNTYPKVSEWVERHHSEISIMLEDPQRPHKPGGRPIFSCWIIFKKFKEIHIDIDLSVSIPEAVDIQDILSILGNRYFENRPKMSIDQDPYLWPCYVIDFQYSILPPPVSTLSHFAIELPKKIELLNKIVRELYAIEKKPANKAALSDLTDCLLEMQV